MASTTPKAGTISPAACTDTSNLPPDRALTVSENFSAEPKMVGSDLGKLDARRQRTAAWACTAGAMPADNTPAIPAFLMRERRSMKVLLRKKVPVPRGGRRPDRPALTNPSTIPQSRVNPGGPVSHRFFDEQRGVWQRGH